MNYLRPDKIKHGAYAVIPFIDRYYKNLNNKVYRRSVNGWVFDGVYSEGSWFEIQRRVRKRHVEWLFKKF